MRFKTALILALVLTSVILWQTSKTLASEEIYTRVWVSSMEEKARLLGEKGLDVASAGPGWVDVVVGSQRLNELIAKGYNVQVQYWTPEEKNIALYGSDWNKAFHTYDQLVTEMLLVASTYPNIVILDTLGYTVQGRMILGAKVSDNPTQEENEPEFRIIGNHHGNEYMGIEIGLNMLHYLTDNYGTNTQVTHLVNDLETWIIPMMNPDGRTAGTRYNANGVDLNRDYGYMWNGEGGSPSIFSQPETRAIRLHGLEHNFSVSLSFHTTAAYVNYVWNYRPFPVPDSAFIVNISAPYASATGYTLVEGYNWYQTYGDCNDWSYGSRGDIDATIETENTNIDPCWNLNRPAILAMMERTDDGVRGRITDATSGQPLEGMVRCTTFGQPVFADPVYGDYQKNLLSGTYSLKFSANGYRDTTISGISVSGTTPTILNVALRPGPELFATHVISCYFYDPYSYPNQYQNNPTNASAALGLPDDLFASLGKGGHVELDMGKNTPIVDLDGPDFTVYEVGSTQDGYRIYWSTVPYNGTWALIGTGFGTTSFDISSLSTDTVRYIKIVDDNDGSATEQYPGCDIDAVTHPKPIMGAYVTFHSYRIDDDSLGQSRGNDDGQVDFGETIELSMVLENLGDSTAYAVEASLSTSQPLVTVTDSSKTYGDIPAGDTAVSSGKYVFIVSSQIQDGTDIPFHLNITSPNKSWGYDGPNITAHAPCLVYQSVDMDDLGGNGNGKPDPGETCSVVVTLKNEGSTNSQQVQATLLSNDPYVTVTSSTSLYPDLTAGDSGTNLTPYQIDISGTCPVGHTASFIIQIQAAGSYSAADTFQVNIGQKPILFVDDDGGGSYETYFLSALDSTGLSYEIWTYATQGTPSDSMLSLYQAVVWTTGPDYGTISSPKTLTATDQARLITYLDNGGKLFLSSQDLLLDNNPTTFITNYLHVAGHTDDTGETSVAGLSGDTISGGMAFGLNPPFYNFSDYLVPGTGAVGIFSATGIGSTALPREGVQPDDYPLLAGSKDSVNYCALRYPEIASSAYQVVFLAFAFEGVPSSGTSPNNSYTLMRRIMDWFGLGRTTPFMRGDVNGDWKIDIGDVVYLINYLFKNGPAPVPLEVGNVNCDAAVDVGDVVYLINYLFKNGASPCE
ncbi:MAG: M14 family zinc carboxypeptidase [Candidatus Zixiibacteriota bacterium]